MKYVGNHHLCIDREISEENECEEMQLLRCAEQLSKADVPEPIRQRILAERATKSATGVKVNILPLSEI